MLYQSACVPQSGFEGYVRAYSDKADEEACVARNKAALAFFAGLPPTDIVISNAKRSEPETISVPTNYLLDRLRAMGHQAFVLGDFMRPGIDLANCRRVPDYLLTHGSLARRSPVNLAAVAAGMKYNKVLGPLLRGFVDVTDVQCPGRVKCKFFDHGMLLFRDDHHLNTLGSILMVRAVRDRLPIAATAVSSKAARFDDLAE